MRVEPLINSFIVYENILGIINRNQIVTIFQLGV